MAATNIQTLNNTSWTVITTDGSGVISNRTSNYIVLYEGDVPPASVDENLGVSITSGDEVSFSLQAGYALYGLSVADEAEIVVSSSIDTTFDQRAFAVAVTTDTGVEEVNSSLDEVTRTDLNGVTAFKTLPVINATTSVDVLFKEDTNTTTTAVVADPLSNTITLTTGHGAVVGQFLGVFDVTLPAYIESEITVVLGDDVTIRSPLGAPYSAGSIAVISDVEMAIDGSVTPVIFSVKPPVGVVINISRIGMAVQDLNGMDYSKFGSLPQLAKGCVLRVKRASGYCSNLFEFATNGDFALRGSEQTYQAKFGGGEVSFNAWASFAGDSKKGTVIRLDGDLGETLEVVVQDNIAALSKFRMIVQGHVTPAAV